MGSYSHGGYSVSVAPDGAIQVRSGDQISHYSMAIYHDFKDMGTRFGRRQGTQVRAFKDISGADINLIRLGETVYDIKTNRDGGWDTAPTSPKAAAHALIDQFEQRARPQAFVQFSRATVAAELRVRVDDPTKIGQGAAGVCGPTSFIYNLARDEPVAYVRMVVELFETGRTRVGNLSVRPAATLFVYKPFSVVGADWIPEASLRNSEDWGDLYPLMHRWTGAFQFAGPSSPWAIAQWFGKVGYTDTKWDVLTGGPAIQRATLMMLSALHRQHWRVVLLIHHELEALQPGPLARLYPDHWVGLTAQVSFSPNPADTTPGAPLDRDDLISMKIFSHQRDYDVGKFARGTIRPIPLTAQDVLAYVWGYAAGRY